MLDLQLIRNEPDRVKEAISLKAVDLNLDHLLELDQNVRCLRRELQELERERNENAAKVPNAGADERAALIAVGRNLSKQIQDQREELSALENNLHELLLLVPNIPSQDSPRGTNDTDNVEIKRIGVHPTFDFEMRDHVRLLMEHDWAEFDRVAQISGTRSYSLKNDLVLLEMALLRFALDVLRARNFELITVPAFAREHAFIGTGHFPTGREQAYFIPKDETFLAGTSEVVVNSLHAGEILRSDALPIRYAALSPCFRREAGSAGRDTRGLIRVHQFWKVEQYIIAENNLDASEQLHVELLTNAEHIVSELELPYRVMAVCTGDMGVGKFAQYDIETWVPSEGKYRETHSCSNLHEWQARRTNLRYRDAHGKVRFCHTLNNTGIATPRILAPFLEIHQCQDGSIRIPTALRPYMSGKDRLE